MQILSGQIYIYIIVSKAIVIEGWSRGPLSLEL